MQSDPRAEADNFDSVSLLKAFHEGTPILLNEATASLHFKDDVSFRSAILVPMRIQDRIIGMLGAFLYQEARGFTEGNRKTLQLYADRVAVSIENVRLYANLEQTFLQTIESLVGALEAKDEYTRGHSERVMQWAMIIGRLCDLSEKRLQDLRRASLLHDIGKIGLNLDALNKPGRLSKDEYDRFKLHPVLGKRILEPIEFLQGAIPGVLHHHEYWDGSGYPLGLAGEEIPILGRILGIADAFEVMVTDRVYRKALPLPEAIAELRRCAGTQFDPSIVKKFTNWLEQFHSAGELPVKGGRTTTPAQPAQLKSRGADEPPHAPSDPYSAEV